MSEPLCSGSSSHRQTFRWLCPHLHLIATLWKTPEPETLNQHTLKTLTHRNHVIIKDHYCFKPLSLGLCSQRYLNIRKARTLANKQATKRVHHPNDLYMQTLCISTLHREGAAPAIKAFSPSFIFWASSHFVFSSTLWCCWNAYQG